MKKLKLYLWILVLFLLSVPAGFLTILTEKPYTPKSEYPLMVIVGTIACTIVVGSLSLIPYFILRKQNKDTALKRAMQCYTFFALTLIAVASYKFPEAMQKRDRYHFSLYYTPVFEKIILEAMEAEKETLPASVLKNQGVFCFCITDGIESNEQLIKKLKMGKDPEDLYYHDPAVKKIKNDCIELYKQ